MSTRPPKPALKFKAHNSNGGSIEYAGSISLGIEMLFVQLGALDRRKIIDAMEKQHIKMINATDEGEG